jgi:hypothetical protein
LRKNLLGKASCVEASIEPVSRIPLKASSILLGGLLPKSPDQMYVRAVAGIFAPGSAHLKFMRADSEKIVS